MASVTARAGSPEQESAGRPLPQRVRQASLTAELKVPAVQADQAGQETWDQPHRSGATIGAFQRQSRKRRTGDDGSQPEASESPEPSSPTTEDR